MKHYDKKEILGDLRIKGAHNLRVVAVLTSNDTITGYIAPSGALNESEKPDKAQKAKYEALRISSANGIINRGSILEKEQTLGFFPKLKKHKYAKKVHSEEFQKWQRPNSINALELLS